MRHLDDGTLRRMYDEPLAISAAAQGHYDGCVACQERAGAAADGARASEQLLVLPGFSPSVGAPYERLKARIAAGEAASPVRWYERWLTPAVPYTQRVTRPVAAVAVSAALLLAFTGYQVVPRLITIFHPTRIVAVQVSPTGLRAGATLDYGTFAWNPAPPEIKQAASLSAAATASGLQALIPGSLPAAVGSAVTYATMGRATASYRFDRATLVASAARQGVPAPRMPDTIDGSTLFVTSGPSLLEVYGSLPVGSGAATGAQNALGAALYGDLPRLVIAETETPTVRSTGASAKQLEDYLVSQPGVPPDVAAQLRAIKDPSSTLPIPIPAGFATSTPVQVQGVQGLLVDAGIAAGVIWQKGGIIYAVGGQLAPDQILQIANSLH